jgi:outer membrane protein OmpA-like peptidoglycan-associated protein
VVFFGFDSDKITPEYEGQLKTFVNKRVNKENDTIVLAGYTDSLGSVEYNKDLAKRRVSNVVSDLNKLGIKEENLSVKYLGEEFDAINKETVITRKNNRKVEITIK